MACSHDICTCGEAGLIDGGRSFCSELCMQAEEEIEKDSAYELCPCAHSSCDGAGDLS